MIKFFRALAWAGGLVFPVPSRAQVAGAAISVTPEGAACAPPVCSSVLFLLRSRRAGRRRLRSSVQFSGACSLLLWLAAIQPGRANTLTENFSTDPSKDGWQVYGDTELFQWDSTNQDLEVTWDSSQPNTYFYHPLGTILAVDDAFHVEFDLYLNDVNAFGTFEMAVSLLNFSDATSQNFTRAIGATPNLFEFDYFPDGGYGPSIDATLSDMSVNATNDGDFYFAYDTVPLELGVEYHVVMNHAAGELGITGEVLTNEQIYTSLPQIYAGPISDFRLDTVSITSYSAAADTFGDSLLAHGTVDNLVVTLPPPPVQNLTGAFKDGLWQAQFTSRTNWIYTLQRTANSGFWSDVASAPGNGSVLSLKDTNPPPATALYRVRSNRP